MSKTKLVILASRSKARRRLLKDIGLKFRVSVSNVKESRSPRKGIAKLVIENSLKKAKDVARRFPDAVIIAADTVVAAAGKIVGKPKDLKDAFRTLKSISRKPQWVYTGIAVIDTENGKVYTAYEKTKIYMYQLTDRQIKNYFRKVSPLDKAGSFDIQGIGGLFIDRLEGCFYNVVGLPLAKLAKILARTGIEIF
jgi:septum formation protein